MIMVPLTTSEAENLLEEWGEPRQVNPDPQPEPATVPTLDLRCNPAEVRDEGAADVQA